MNNYDLCFQRKGELEAWITYTGERSGVVRIDSVPKLNLLEQMMANPDKDSLFEIFGIERFNSSQ